MTVEAQPLTAPLHPTVLDALRNTPAAPLAAQPVAQVLATIGLPDLPQPIALPPLPGLPALPALDLTGLIKPITDLFGGFGTGMLGANGAVNPQSLLQNVVQGLGTAMQWGEQGLQLLQSMQGQGAQAATASGVAAQGDSASVSSQAGRMDTTLGAAATTVATGAAEIAAVAAKLVTTEALLAPLAATPGGQAALLAAAAEAAAEAAAITAATKAQLLAHSATMTQAGSPVSISGGSANTIGTAQSALEQLMSGVQVVQQVAQPLVLTALQEPVKNSADPVSLTTTADTALIAGVGGAVSGRTARTAEPLLVPEPIGGISERAELSAWQANDATRVAATAVTEPAAETATAAAVTEAPSPMVPAGGALAAVRARTSNTTGAPEALVNVRHGDELVGADLRTEPPAPVIGAITTDDAAPDTPFSL